MSPQRVSLLTEDAEALLKHARGGRVSQWMLARAVERTKDALAPSPSPKKTAAAKANWQDKRAKWAAHGAETSAIYVTVEKRADGKCEACGAHFAPFNPPHMDHEEGRAKTPQSVENCWMLCLGCDRAKTDYAPSRAYWAEKFIAHCEKHGYRAEAERARNDLAWVEAKNSAPAAPQSLHVSTRQLEVLQEIAVACDTGLPPTVRELGKTLGIGSTNAVKDHLKALVAKQLITVESQKARAIRVTEYGQALLERVGSIR